MNILSSLLIVLIVLVAYFLPWIVAYRRKHPKVVVIAVVNFFLGWTFLGWVVALVWAVMKEGWDIRTVNKKVQQSWLFGSLIAFGVVLIVLVIMANIKIVPYTVYKSAEFHFEIKYPSYWQKIEKPEGGAAVAFVSPLQNNLDMFHENFNIVYQDLSSNPMTLNQFTSTAIKQLTGTLEGFVEVMETSPTTLAGRPAYRFVFRGAGPNNPHPIEYYHVWVLDGTNAYILTFAGMQSDFNSFKSKLNDMIGSFKIE